MKIQTPKPTKDGYVSECFSFDFEEDIETRNWRNLPETVNIPALAMGPRPESALPEIEKALELYPDFLFLYVWKGYVYGTGIHNYPTARQFFEEGLEKSRSKISLLDQLGQWEHDHGEFHLAIMFWIKSCAVQLSTRQLDYAHPFMMLEYVAAILKLRKEANALWRQKCRIDNIALNYEGENLIRMGVRSLEIHNVPLSKSVKMAIQILCKHYRVGK